MKIGPIVAVDKLFKLAVSSIQYLQLNWNWSFFLFIKMKERFIKIQLAPINKCYIKFKHVSALSEL